MRRLRRVRKQKRYKQKKLPVETTKHGILNQKLKSRGILKPHRVAKSSKYDVVRKRLKELKSGASSSTLPIPSSFKNNIDFYRKKVFFDAKTNKNMKRRVSAIKDIVNNDDNIQDIIMKLFEQELLNEAGNNDNERRRRQGIINRGKYKDVDDLKRRIYGNNT